MFGYHGKVISVNLTLRETACFSLDEGILKRFIGGTGLGTYLLYKLCPPMVNPLGPDNPLIFVTSPLVGSKLTTSSKYAVLTKSPLTGMIGDSLSSSFLATELKGSGYDALVITGRSKSPTSLFIENGEVKFIDAVDLLGLSTSETEAAVKSRFGRMTRVACIGPAGEKLVRFASIANDGGRQAGRTGPGAVMGSKNLKAIAIQGRAHVPICEPDKLLLTGRDLARRSLGSSTEKYRTIGTIANMAVFNRLGTLPTRNFQQSTFDQAEQLSGEEFVKSHKVRNAHCANCTIGCEHIMVTTDAGKHAEGRVEYESAFALGPLVGIGDPNAVIRSSHLCDELGMDTISTGGTLAWAMECVERGVLPKDDIDLRFGEEKSLMSAVRLIARRQGLGDLLADGSRKAAKKIGHGSSEWAMHVKGLELPGYEPRSLKTMALGLAVSTRGACHNRSSAYDADFSTEVDRLKADENRGRITMEGEDFSAVIDSLIWCKFLRKIFHDFYEESAQIYQHITGWEMTAHDLRQAGERINNLKKLFNIREGWTREDDTLPPRIFKDKLPTGVARGVGLTSDQLDMMIRAYYKARGWTEGGDIPDKKIRELELTDVVRANKSGT